MAEHIDYSKEADFRMKYLTLTGGAASENLTVRDVFAVEAMGGLLSDVDWRQDMEGWEDAAFAAYQMADAMMKERAK